MVTVFLLFPDIAYKACGNSLSVYQGRQSD